MSTPTPPPDPRADQSEAAYLATTINWWVGEANRLREEFHAARRLRDEEQERADVLERELDDAQRLVGEHGLALSACRDLIRASGWPRDCPHCGGSGYVEATRFDGADAGPCGECGGTGVRDRNVAPDLVERFAAENERADTLFADVNAERDRADGLAALLAEQKAANLALADRLAAASAALTQAAERRPDPFADLAAWEGTGPGRSATFDRHAGRWVLTLTRAAKGVPFLIVQVGCWPDLDRLHREDYPHDTSLVHVPDAADPAAVVRAALARWAELEPESGPPRPADPGPQGEQEDAA